MRSTTVLSLLSIALLLAFTCARPTPLSHSIKHKLNPRNVEEELATAAEDSIELFEFPRVHDSSEQIHEHTEKHNVTTQRILEAIRDRQHRSTQLRVQSLPVAASSEGTYSYDRQSNEVGLYSLQDERGDGRVDGYAVNSQQSGFARYRVGEYASK